MITLSNKHLIIICTIVVFFFSNHNGWDTNDLLVVMSLNVRYDNPSDAPNDWKTRLPLIIKTIEEQSPNIIGLQEVLKNQLDDLDSLLPGYGHAGVGRDDGREAGEFSPVFYKKARLEVVEQGTFWLSPAPGDTGSIGWDAALPRIVTWARFRDLQVKHEGKPSEFYFLNTHFDHVGDTARLESVRLILEFIRDRTEGLGTVVTGDFNFNPSKEPYLVITNGYEGVPGLHDACRATLTGTPCDEPTFNGFGKARENSRIDFIFTTEAWNVSDYETLVVKEKGIYISDHYPILLQINP